MKIHELKCWPQPFFDVASGAKRCEVRQNDRDFRVGDRLFLRCWDPEREGYTGQDCVVEVTHVLCGPDWGLSAGLVVMSVVLLETP